MARRTDRTLDGEEPLFDPGLYAPVRGAYWEPPEGRGKSNSGGYRPTFDHYPPEVAARTDLVLWQLESSRYGLTRFQRRCQGCERIIAAQAPHCGRRVCPAFYPRWKRDQKTVVREALREYGGLLLLTDVTLPGTPEQERNRRNVAIPWDASGMRRGDPKALYKANRRFKARMRWAKRKAYNAGRSALLRSGIPFEHLPPVLVSNVEVQKRGALHAHLALPYTTPAERVFTQAFIDCLKKLAPTCGLGFVQGWQQAEKTSLLGHERAASYMTKYLTDKHPPAFLRTIKGPVVTASQQLTRRTGCTMGMLRKSRRLWAVRHGHCEPPDWDWDTAIRAGYLLDRRTLTARAP